MYKRVYVDNKEKFYNVSNGDKIGKQFRSLD